MRYDLRDSGASSIVDPEAHTYTLRVLAADAAALVRDSTTGPAHLAGIGVGGMVVQVFPVGNGEALAREIPDARPLVLERAATAIPDAVAEKSRQRCLRSRRSRVPARRYRCHNR